MMEIKSGTLDDFFESAKETAEEVDRGRPVTRKKSIWLDTEDFIKLLKPSRIELIKILRGEKKVYISDLMERLHKSRTSVGRDLELLRKYGLVDIETEVNPSHGQKKVVRPLYGDEPIEFRVAV
ncbi:HVO_A0114 family putative DNA-binding protein [Hydrogenimonas sp.]